MESIFNFYKFESSLYLIDLHSIKITNSIRLKLKCLIQTDQAYLINSTCNSIEYT